MAFPAVLGTLSHSAAKGELIPPSFARTFATAPSLGSPLLSPGAGGVKMRFQGLFCFLGRGVCRGSVSPSPRIGSGSSCPGAGDTCPQAGGKRVAARRVCLQQARLNPCPVNPRRSQETGSFVSPGASSGPCPDLGFVSVLSPSPRCLCRPAWWHLPRYRVCPKLVALLSVALAVPSPCALVGTHGCC